MDGETWGWIGGFAGTAVGCLGAYFGCRASYRNASNPAQRHFYRKIFAAIVPLALAFLIAIWLTSSGTLPRWIYFLVMGLWFAALMPAILWMNRRLSQLAAEDG